MVFLYRVGIFFQTRIIERRSNAMYDRIGQIPRFTFHEDLQH